MGKNKYKATNGAGFPQEEAQTIGEFLEKLTEERGGQLVPQEIVDAAEDTHSPIHNYFEWNNELAGKEYRKYQARRLINHIVIINAVQQKAFYSIKVPIEEKGVLKTTQAYMTQERVLSIKDYRQQTLDSAIKQIEYWHKQYESFNELSKIHVAIEITVKELERRAKEK